jgi:hypothetical protein
MNTHHTHPTKGGATPSEYYTSNIHSLPQLNTENQILTNTEIMFKSTKYYTKYSPYCFAIINIIRIFVL